MPREFTTEEEEPAASTPRLHLNPPSPPLERRRKRPAVEAMEEEKGFQPHLMGDDGRMRGASGQACERRRHKILGRGRRSPLQRARSVTEDELDELRGSLDLGFRFDPPSQRCAACDAGRSRLVETLPALDLLYAVNANAGAGGGCAASHCSCGASSEASEPSPIGSPLSILSPDDPPETVKMRLKQWAQVVALSMRSRS